MLGQLLWHRLVHDEGLDAWGVGRGEPRRVLAQCLVTVDCDVAEVAEQLDRMVAMGMLYRYEVDGAVYIAARNWDRYQSWRRHRGLPEHPWDQEVADMRDLTKLDESVDRRASGGKLDALMRWADDCGISVSVDCVRNANAMRTQRGDDEIATGAQCDDDANALRAPCSVRSSVEESRVAGACARIENADETQWPGPAERAFAACGVSADRVLSESDAGMSSAADADPRVYALALALEVRERTKPDGAAYHNRPVRLLLKKLRERDPAEPPYIKRALAILHRAPPGERIPMTGPVSEADRVAYRCTRAGCRQKHNGGMIELVAEGSDAPTCQCGAPMRRMGEGDQ